MKNPIMLSLFLVAITGMGFAQEPKSQCIPLIGDVAPSFTAESTEGTLAFPEDFGRNWKILFSHPADYTPVCSSEIIELAAAQSEFDELGVKLAVISTDALDKHYSWKKSLETVQYQGREPVKIHFPLIADEKRVIARSYGMLQPASQFLKNIRGVFIINPDNKVEAIFLYPMNVGRNIEEIRRTVAALQTASTYEVLTPANWKPGEDVMVPYLHPVDEATVESRPDDPGTYSLTWYMLFKKLKSQDK
jgi:peroxiredoxin 2/4